MTGKVCVVEGVEDREDARNPPHVEHNGSKMSMRDRGLRHLVPSATQLQRQHASDGKAECAYGSDSNPKVLEVAEQRDRARGVGEHTSARGRALRPCPTELMVE